jgi:hypothetical protein
MPVVRQKVAPAVEDKQPAELPEGAQPEPEPALAVEDKQRAAEKAEEVQPELAVEDKPRAAEALGVLAAAERAEEEAVPPKRREAVPRQPATTLNPDPAEPRLLDARTERLRTYTPEAEPTSIMG